MNRLSAWLVIGSLLLVVFGAPAYEVAGGNWPTAGMTGEVTLESVLTGGAAQEVEDTLEERALLSERVRPRYNELMFLTLGVTTPRVLVGEDDWLFLASRIVGGRPEAAMRRLPRTCAELAELVDWFAAHGTHVIFEFIPRKQSLYPDQLPDDLNPPFEPVYPELLAAMRDAGLHVVDLSDELGPADGVFFLTNDDHWNHAGSLRAARAVADEIRALYPDGDVPGTPVEAEIRETESYRFAGNLVAMLGFQKDGFLYDRFSVDRARIRSFVPGGPRPLLGSDEPQPIVLLGTSFSAGFHTASLLLGLLGREVEDRAEAGLAGGYRMVDLCREILTGERGFPELLVWEFPEDFLVQSVPYFSQPVVSVVDVERGFPYREAPLAAERSLSGVRVLEEDADGFEGRALTRDPRITYTLAQPVPGDGSRVLAFPVLVSGNCSVVTAWDTGPAPGSGGTHDRFLRNSEFPHWILVRLRTSDGRPIHRVHVSPRGAPRFHLGPPQLWTPERVADAAPR